jgi:hypothetical protein
MDNKEQIEKVVNKFLLSYGEEPINYNEVFYNAKKNIGINVFMFLCDIVEDLSQPKEVEPKKEVDLEELRKEFHNTCKTKVFFELSYLSSGKHIDDVFDWFASHLNLQKPVESECEKCLNCGKGNKEPIHKCPYQQDVNNDENYTCTCCENCQHECAQDI